MVWTLVGLVLLAILIPLLRLEVVASFWRDAYSEARRVGLPYLRRGWLIATALLQLGVIAVVGLAFAAAALFALGLLGLAAHFVSQNWQAWWP